MDHSDNYNNHRQQENLGVCAAEPLLLQMHPDGAFTQGAQKRALFNLQ